MHFLRRHHIAWGHNTVALMISNKLERHLITMYAKSINNDPIQKAQIFKSTILSRQRYIYQTDTQRGLKHDTLLQMTNTF